MIVYNILGKTPTKVHASNEPMKKHILIYESTEVGLRYFLTHFWIVCLNFNNFIWLHLSSRLKLMCELILFITYELFAWILIILLGFT